MSLYRQAGGISPRALVVGVLVAALVGALIGFLLGRGSVEDPSPADVVAEARAELRPVAAGLELVPIEYEGAFRGGRVAPTELKAAQDAASRAAAELEAASEDMRAIDPAGYAEAASTVEELSSALDSTASQARVEALATRAQAAVEELSGGSE
jgi:hypothetical protein